MTIAFSLKDWPRGLWVDIGPHELHWTRSGLWWCVLVRGRWWERRP